MGMDLLCSKTGTHMTASGEKVRFMAKENCGAAVRMRCQKVKNAKGMWENLKMASATEGECSIFEMAGDSKATLVMAHARASVSLSLFLSLSLSLPPSLFYVSLPTSLPPAPPTPLLPSLTHSIARSLTNTLAKFARLLRCTTSSQTTNIILNPKP
jgi:hypothetical protein